MNQCVPNWNVEENQHPPVPAHRFNLRAHSNSSSSVAPDVPTLDYEVTELTWQNGQLAMQGLGLPRGKTAVAAAPAVVKYTWEKQLPAGETLEALVNQATTILPNRKPKLVQQSGGGDELVPWFEDHHHHRPPAATASSLGLTMDALVPCNNKASGNDQEPIQNVPNTGTCLVGVGCSATHVGSCSVATTSNARVPRVSGTTATAGEQSCSISATFGTVERCDRELVVTPGGFTSPSLGSLENTSSATRQFTKTVDEHDSACQSRNERDTEDKKGNGKSSTKRSRAAAIHNQSERKRRDKINQRMKTLQKLVPNSSKTDKASMLDEVIEYLKQLQAQVNLMSRMNMPSMILPLALQQQQLQMMSMMSQLGMGMNMGMAGMGVMDLNSIGRANMAAAGMTPHLLHPSAFMPQTSWDGGLGAPSSSSPMPDHLAAFLACQSQPTTMDAYARMAALYQQFQQSQGPAPQ